jgi:hypothetical protein
VDTNSFHEPNIIDYLGEKKYQSYWGKETYQNKGYKKKKLPHVNFNAKKLIRFLTTSKEN